MGEVVLRRLQAGLETVRGTPVAATKKLYGTLTMSREQQRRWAVEDRGMYTDKFRGNPKLIVAGFTLNHDLTFEDAPYYLAHLLNGTTTASTVASAASKWVFNPDVNTDGLKTSTFEAGDDSVAWQAPFCTVDSMAFNMVLDDVLTSSTVGFCQDWIPQTSSNLTTGFAGYTGSISERSVESVMGWQSRLYVDNSGGTMGATQVTGRHIAAKWNVKNNNKTKYYGDASAVYQLLGRGRRQIDLSITFEALDTAQYAAFQQSPNLKELLVREQFIGGAITGSTWGTTSGVIAAGTVTSIPVSALAAAIPGGAGISVGGTSFAVTSAGAALNATAIPVVSQVIPVQIPTTQTVMAAKTMLFDFYVNLDSFVPGARDTNTNFTFTGQAIYDSTAGRESQVTIYNGSSTL